MSCTQCPKNGVTDVALQKSINSNFCSTYFPTSSDAIFVTSPSLILKRLHMLSTNGPLLGISFLCFWFLWTYPGLQFVVCLCLYDGFLTAVDLHHTALLADLALSAKER